MSINRVDFPTTPLPVGGDWAKINTLMSKAFQNLYMPLQVDSSNILDGATFQIAGVIYYTNGDTAIAGTPSAYVKITPNVGDSGATADAIFVANLTGVTFNNIYNGYYDISDNLHIFDEADSALNNTKFGELVNNIMPIGYVYIQFPTKDSPVDLGLYGTWTNISSSFAGDFFRAEGGNAAAFESHQDDAVINHTHDTIMGSHDHEYDTAAVSTSGPNVSGTVAESSPGHLNTDSTDLGTKVSGNPNADNAIENRPNNYAIRLWERIA